jgi:hypothetical protein
VLATRRCRAESLLLARHGAGEKVRDPLEAHARPEEGSKIELCFPEPSRHASALPQCFHGLISAKRWRGLSWRTPKLDSDMSEDRVHKRSDHPRGIGDLVWVGVVIAVAACIMAAGTFLS